MNAFQREALSRIDSLAGSHELDSLQAEKLQEEQARQAVYNRQALQAAESAKSVEDLKYATVLARVFPIGEVKLLVVRQATKAEEKKYLSRRISIDDSYMRATDMGREVKLKDMPHTVGREVKTYRVKDTPLGMTIKEHEELRVARLELLAAKHIAIERGGMGFVKEIEEQGLGGAWVRKTVPGTARPFKGMTAEELKVHVAESATAEWSERK